MAAIRFTVTGLSAAQTATEKLAALDGAKRGLAAAAQHLQTKSAEYPPQRRISRESVYGRSFKSAAQRRYVMGALRRGEWPYQRGISGSSEALGRRWARETRMNGFVQVVGNNASYAENVMGDDQSLYMAAKGWKKVSDIAEREDGVMRRLFDSYAGQDVS